MKIIEKFNKTSEFLEQKSIRLIFSIPFYLYLNIKLNIIIQVKHG